MDGKPLVLKIKRPKGEDGNKVFSIRIKSEIVEKLDAISSETGHSRNELIGTLLEFALNNVSLE